MERTRLNEEQRAKVIQYMMSLVNTENHIPFDRVEIANRAQEKYGFSVSPKTVSSLAKAWGYTLERKVREVKVKEVEMNLALRLDAVEDWLNKFAGPDWREYESHQLAPRHIKGVK